MDELTASEALFGFMGWLTARDEQVVFSASNHAAPAAELVVEFCKVNGLSEPREDWTTRLIMPPTAEISYQSDECPKGGDHAWTGDDGGEWCEKCFQRAGIR
jgi:hypothetical protein